MQNIINKISKLFQKQKKIAQSAETSNQLPSISLAKSQFSAGKHATAIRTIESVLFKQPEQMDALQWWVAIHQKKLTSSGMNKEKAYYAVLKEASKRFSTSITIKSLLIQFCHKYGKKDLALAWYNQALLLADATDPHLIETTVLLKNAGWLNQSSKNEAPPITPTHEQTPPPTYAPPPPQYEEISPVVSTTPPLVEEKEISETDTPSAYETSPQSMPHKAADWWGVDQPLWCYGWENAPSEIEPPQSANRIVLFQFTGKFNIANAHHAWTADNILAQISCAIPLYLLEDIYYHSDYAASVVFPVSATGQLDFLTEKINKNTLISVLGDNYPAAITGHFTGDKLELSHVNLQTQEETTRIVTLNPMNVGRILPAIEKFLFETCGINLEERSEYAELGFSQISAEGLDSYLAALSQHLILVNACYYPQAAANLQKPHRIIRHFLDLAFSVPALQSQLILLSSIQQNMTLHSEAIKDYQEPLLAWLSEEAVNPGPMHKLASETWEKFATYCGVEEESGE